MLSQQSLNVDTSAVYMNQADIVIDSKTLDISFLQDLNRPVLMFMGDAVFDTVKIVNKNNLTHFYFVKIENLIALDLLIEKWDLIRFRHPVKGFLMHDGYIQAFFNSGEHTKRIKSSFKNVPLIAISNSIDEEIKDLCFEIKADDLIFEETAFPLVISKISFAKKLKRFGVTKQDAVLKKDKKYKMYFLKRLFDIVVSGTALLLASPIMVVVALIIRLESKGPIFYISQRAGNFYKVFDFYKFRSMQPNADQLLTKLKETSNQYKDGNQFVKIKDDPRITKFGHFIRNTSIDELPQLINVLKGDMSIVGNRPLPLYEAELLVTDDHAERFLAPAGITGLWQTLKRGKSDMSSEERIALDRIYVRKNSIWFDMKLILMTIPALILSLIHI